MAEPHPCRSASHPASLPLLRPQLLSESSAKTEDAEDLPTSVLPTSPSLKRALGVFTDEFAILAVDPVSLAFLTMSPPQIVSTDGEGSAPASLPPGLASAALPASTKSHGVMQMELLSGRLDAKYRMLLYSALALLGYAISLGVLPVILDRCWTDSPSPKTSTPQALTSQLQHRFPSKLTRRLPPSASSRASFRRSASRRSQRSAFRASRTQISSS